MGGGAKARARSENTKKLGGAIFVGTPGDVAQHKMMLKLLESMGEHYPLRAGEPVPLAAFRGDGHRRVQMLRTATAALIGVDRLERAERSEKGLRIFYEGASTGLNFLAALMATDHPLRFGLGTRFSLPSLTRMHIEAVALATASRVSVRMHDNGFFGNFLQVLDVLVHAPAEARLYVDWRCDGHEGHFTYGSEAAGTNVFDALFEPVGRADDQARLDFGPPPAAAEDGDRDAGGDGRGRAYDAILENVNRSGGDGVVRSHARVNLYLSACFRGLYFDAPEYAAHRRAYCAQYRTRIRVSDPWLLTERAAVRRRLAGAYAIGVHKRVATPATEQMQRRLRIPSVATFADVAAHLYVARGGGQRRVVVYLATDDATAPPVFRDVFGDALVVRDAVRRTEGGVAGGAMNEVHNQPGCGLQEARDALLDALCLAECDVVIHVDSNVALSVAYMNCDLELVHAAAHSDDPADREDQFTDAL